VDAHEKPWSLGHVADAAQPSEVVVRAVLELTLIIAFALVAVLLVGLYSRMRRETVSLPVDSRGDNGAWTRRLARAVKGAWNRN
jgi:hypothetical protein